MRPSMLAAVLALTLLAGAIVVASHVLISRFDAIELEQARDKAMQALRAFEADLHQLAVSTRDYAEWDDAQRFIRDRNDSFLSANFSVASLSGMQVDRMAILDRTGELLYGAQVEPGAEELTALDPTFIERVRGLRSHVDALRRAPSTDRLLATDAGLFAFAIVEIARSDGSEPTAAVLFFARAIRSDEIERIRNTSRLPVEFRSIESATAAAPAADLEAAVVGADISGRTVVRDWLGVPQATLTVTSPRAIGELGRRTTAVLMGAITLLIVLCATVFFAMMRRQSRLWRDRVALQARHEQILASLGEYICLVDPAESRLVEGNAAVLQALGYEAREFGYLDLSSVFIDLHASDLDPAGDLRTGLRGCRLRARDGHLIECEINVTPLFEGDPPLTCIVARDVTQRRLDEQLLRENQSRLAHLVEHDALTGLPNRDYLQTRLPALLHRVAEEQGSLALMYLDIDHFKNVNDSQGHGFGDQMLKIVSLRLRACVCPEDTVLRMGGDEFVIVMALRSDSGEVKRIAARLMEAISAPIVHEGFTIALTASIGVATYPQDGLDAESLLKHADIALFQAKERGRHCIVHFASDMNVQVSEHVVLEQALRRSLNTDQIQIAYQPVVDLHTGLLVSFEALARWNHPELGPIPPGRFIPVAERSGLIAPLGEQILRNVIAQLRQWQDAGLTLAPVAVNVAPIQFERTEFATLVHEAALEYDIDPRLIAFEVTESALLQDSNKHIVAIDTLRHAGSRVYIDDFGTGFSNLGYLKTLPVDAVKIDQSFVRTIETDPNDAAIVSSIIHVARQLRLDTIAEGIETASQAELLRQLGCRYGQGYYFSKPMPASHCRALLEQLGASRRLTETVKIRAFRQAG